MNYNNPIISGFNPDPSICRVGEDFYLVTSSFEFFPGVPIYHSKNLVNWELISYCLTDDIQLPLSKAKASYGIYAPTVRYYDGTFFMTVTNVSYGGNFIVHTKDVRGKWSEPAYVEQKGIDPSLFWDDDGTCYFVSNSAADYTPGIHVCEIDPFTAKMLSPSRCISMGCGGSSPEAPHIYKANGYYYLALAEGGTEYGHMETVQRAKSIYGPYEKCPRNPILTHRSTSSPIQVVGHADFVDDQNGNWWLVCLGVRPLPRTFIHNLGRETFLAPLKWDEDGWPIAGNNGRIELIMDAFLPGPAPTPVNNSFSDCFLEEKIDLNWNFIRNPRRERYTLSKGRIILSGCEERLSTPLANPTAMILRQPAFCTETVAYFEGDVVQGQCSGLTAYYNNDYHYDIVITKEEGCHYVCLRKKVADIDIIAARHKVDYNGSIRFKLESNTEWYVFSYEIDGEFIEVGRGSTSLLCTEVTYPRTFTGMFFGIFSENGDISVTKFEMKE